MAPTSVTVASKAKLPSGMRAAPGLFHKRQPRRSLNTLAPNSSGVRVEQVCKVVKPTLKTYTASVAFKGVGGSTRLIKQTVRAPKELFQPIAVDKTAIHKPLMDLVEKARAEKKEEKQILAQEVAKRKEFEDRVKREVDSLFQSDDEDCLPSIEDPEETGDEAPENMDLHSTRSATVDMLVDWSKGDDMTLSPSIGLLAGIYFGRGGDSEKSLNDNIGVHESYLRGYMRESANLQAHRTVTSLSHRYKPANRGYRH